jgi:hypothetical protein
MSFLLRLRCSLLTDLYRYARHSRLAGAKNPLLQMPTYFQNTTLGTFDFLKAPKPVLLALGFDKGVAFQFLFKHFDSLGECRRIDAVSGFLVFFEKMGEAEFRCAPNICFQTFTNDLASDFYSAIVICVVDVLQQMRQFWK